MKKRGVSLFAVIILLGIGNHKTKRYGAKSTPGVNSLLCNDIKDNLAIYI